MEKEILGIDLGGTNIRAAKVRGHRITGKQTVVLDNKGGKDGIINQLFHMIDDMQPEYLSGIGIGVPSYVDIQSGVVYDAVNLPGWVEVPLKALLERQYHIPVNVNNDSNCFVLGEKHYGKARDYQSVVGLTLGTGLGAGIIINGQLYTGKNCGAGEFSSLPYLDKNYEYYTSSEFFHGEHNISAYEAWLQAHEGDMQALNIFREYGKHFAALIKVALTTYDPEAIILGGSISRAWDYFRDSMYESLRDFEFQQYIKNMIIERSEKDDIALLGAAHLLLDTCV
ncbi:MAG: ROK family protein [Bacteroidota bacterium]